MGGNPRISRLARPFYQPVLDAIKARPHPWLTLVLDFCEAVEAEDRGKVAVQTGPLVRTVDTLKPPVEDLPPQVFYEIMVRMLFMNVCADLIRIIEWYERPTILRLAKVERITENWVETFEIIGQPPPGLSERELHRQLTRHRHALECVLRAYAEAEAVAGPPKPPRIVDVHTVDERERGFGTAVGFRPTRIEALEAGIAKLVWSIMAVYQQFFDAALAHLGSRKSDRGVKLLALRSLWDATIEATFDRYRKSLRLHMVKVKLANIRYGRSPRHLYIDAFPPHDARRFGFTPYNRQPPDQPDGKSARLVDLLRYRWNQLNYILDDFGEYYLDYRPGTRPPRSRDAEAARKKAFTERRALIDKVEKKAKSLHLKSLDDLISFGCAYHGERLGTAVDNATPEQRVQAWLDLLEFLRRHLTTQTIHAEFNLDEAPSYFDRDFPRAINGGALYDCGVYAVLYAYVFLSLAHCVSRRSKEARRPRVTFLMLPLHVGLIVEIDDLPIVVLHNDVLTVLPEDELARFRAEWNSVPDVGGPDPTDPTRRERKFIEDVAAQLLNRDVDTPLIRFQVAPVSSPPRKIQIWNAFRRLVVPTLPYMFSRNIDNPARSVYQFDLRYLDVLGIERNWQNANVVRFWNEVCHNLWHGVAPGGDPQAVLKQSAAKRKAYATELLNQVTAIEASYDKDVRPAKDRLTKDLRANMGVVGRRVHRVTTASRLEQSAKSIGPVGQVRSHVDEIRQGIVNVPPFASESEFLNRHPE